MMDIELEGGGGMVLGRTSVIQENPLNLSNGGGTSSDDTDYENYVFQQEITEYDTCRLPFRKRHSVLNGIDDSSPSPGSSSSEQLSPSSMSTSTHLSTGMDSNHSSEGKCIPLKVGNLCSLTAVIMDMSDSTRQTSGESSASASPTGSGTGSGSSKHSKIAKTCDVCGDVAKSLHFGGLSCDSCKAFFRRAVHKDAYRQFSCAYDNFCDITKQTRKSCQKCRFEKCIRIGMEKKWVMSEEERKELHEQRIGRKKKLQETSIGGVSPLSSEHGSGSPTKLDHPLALHGYAPQFEYIPDVDDMLNYMSEKEQQNIREVCENYRISYLRIPYNTPKTSESIRNTLQIIGMFTTILRRFAYFCKLVPEFRQLSRDDQGNLLKASVLEMVMLRGALSFDIENHRWPNSNLEFLANCPQLQVEDMKHLVSPELFEMHMSFITKIQKLQVDEPTTMLLLLIVMFYPERELEDVERVSLAQEKYCELLRKYVNWRYGPGGSKLYPKLLTQLADLRQLNDLHTEYHLNLADTEVNVIRQDLSQLQLDPYPQLNISPVNSSPGKSTMKEGSSPKFPFQQDQFSPPAPTFNTEPESPPNVTLPFPSPTSTTATSRTRPIRSHHTRVHSRMREAFIRRIPQLIDDPFGPLMTPEEMMRMGQQFGGLLSQQSQPQPLQNPTPTFDPWQHRHHETQTQPRTAPALDRSQSVPQSVTQFQHFQQYINDPNNPIVDMNSLQNIQSIMESLNDETRARLRSMFLGGGDGLPLNLPTDATISPGSMTPGLFPTRFAAPTGVHRQLPSNVNLANLEFANQNPGQND